MAFSVGPSLREQAKSTNSLLCLLQALTTRVTTVELRNESSARGRIVNVDGFMNVQMGDVTFTTARGETRLFEYFYVQGKQVRFVHIPDNVDIIKAIEGQLRGLGKTRAPAFRAVAKMPKRKAKPGRGRAIATARPSNSVVASVPGPPKNM
ncbi:PREDICTED: U7 snRNA-associated Sm-like protein LSm10 [Priapulus caudatus]|uniref:U7 snRNA-associated Sm-like protein LSm10 n=1 Tax=Priapulus caudatus TaxID=37621 RepID=A0ABM1ECF1_PRICU|nr:PREDICTED: U7 snRNA-associated Sm-like protein LSm10 [Priapulus caudatus]